MIRTKFTALVFAVVFVAVLIFILGIVVFIVSRFPVFVLTLSGITLLVIYYKEIYKELKSRRKEEQNHGTEQHR